MANKLDIIGLPPGGTKGDVSAEKSEAVRRNFLPILNITPCRQILSGDLHLFDLAKEAGEKQYIEDFKAISRTVCPSVTIIEPPIRVAFLAENFPSESFSSEYGETFLEKFTDIASGTMGEIGFMLGAQNISQASNQIQEMLKNIDIPGASFVGQGLGSITEMGGKLKEGLSKVAGGGALSRTIDVLSGMAAGGRVDLPKVWKNSNYSVSYTITVRLYNPDPGSREMTEQSIIAPLLALLLFVLPKAVAGNEVFNYPYLCKVDCPGVFNLPAGFVSSINVVKGGDQGLLGHNQTMGMVDVRMEFGNLYGTLLQGLGRSNSIPSALNYLENMVKGRKLVKTVRFKKSSSNPKQNIPTKTTPFSPSSRSTQEQKDLTDNLEPVIPT